MKEKTVTEIMPKETIADVIRYSIRELPERTNFKPGAWYVADPSVDIRLIDINAPQNSMIDNMTLSTLFAGFSEVGS